jgi:membrane protease YdiL (CAAX protease family)
LGEEIGWRGFLLPQLSRRHSPLIASLVVAVAWFAWHLPAYALFGKGRSDPILPFAAILIPFSLVLAWTYFRSGESLLLPVLLHGSINASFYSMVDLLPAVTDSPSFEPAFDWTVASCWYLIGAVVLAFFGSSLGRARGGAMLPDRASTGSQPH